MSDIVWPRDVLVPVLKKNELTNIDNNLEHRGRVITTKRRLTTKSTKILNPTHYATLVWKMMSRYRQT